ncbi:MAG: ATP-binding cassette domain-containing protein [Archaeoglobales archaeon]|nr:ATP-binding cassette domain-containing protein [Archaeoglobales archaeon]
MIDTKELICGYGKFAVTKELNLCFNEGIYLIYGPNGSGKTTILKTISGLLRPIKGKVYFCGRDIYRERRILKNLFYLSEKINPPEFLKTKDYLGFVFSFYGLELRRTIEKVKEFLNQFDLG